LLEVALLTESRISGSVIRDSDFFHMALCVHLPGMMDVEKPRLFSARSGVLSVERNGAPYHSPYDPVREAEKFCSTLKIEDADVILLFGWGLGYCGTALQKRMKPGTRVIVFEPDSGLFELSRDHGATREALRSEAFQFVVGASVGRFFDDWALNGCRETDQFLWIEWPQAAAQHREMLDSLKANFRKCLRDKAANLLTHFRNGEMYFQNALANFRFQASADAGRLFGQFKNVPLVIVAAGPSLDRNIADLRGAEDRCFILSMDTSLRPLLAAGITPHAVMAADPSDLNARHIAGVVPEQVYLIAEQGVQSSALESANRRFLFGVGLFPDPLFAKFGFGKSSLDVWGSVATAALDLACHMGVNPVIFIGQDFAYSWGRQYASHTIFDGLPFSAELGGPLKEMDVWGELVHTTENLVAYRDFFSRKIRSRPDIRFINATEGGILRLGVEILPLQEALRLTGSRRIDAAALLRDNYRIQQTTHKALTHFLDTLQLRRTDCGCLSAFLELVAKQALLGDDSGVIEKKIQWGIQLTEQALAG
jgi:hypothetical protein